MRVRPSECSDIIYNHLLEHYLHKFKIMTAKEVNVAISRNFQKRRKLFMLQLNEISNFYLGSWRQEGQR